MRESEFLCTPLFLLFVISSQQTQQKMELTGDTPVKLFRDTFMEMQFAWKCDKSSQPLGTASLLYM